MLDKLVNERLILKLLPQGEMLDLKLYSEQLLDKSNEKLIEYFTRFDINSKIKMINT